MLGIDFMDISAARPAIVIQLPRCSCSGRFSRCAQDASRPTGIGLGDHRRRIWLLASFLSACAAIMNRKVPCGISGASPGKTIGDFFALPQCATRDLHCVTVAALRCLHDNFRPARLTQHGYLFGLMAQTPARTVRANVKRGGRR